MKNKCTKFRNYRPYMAKSLGTWQMFDNPTDNHTDIEVPLYYKLRFTKLKMDSPSMVPQVENLIPYLRVYHVENYVIHHHVALHSGSRSKNADLKISLLLLQRSRRSTVKKENTRTLGGASREITCWHQASESSAWCQQVISLLAPPDSGCFPLVTALHQPITWPMYLVCAVVHGKPMLQVPQGCIVDQTSYRSPIPFIPSQLTLPFLTYFIIWKFNLENLSPRSRVKVKVKVT